MSKESVHKNVGGSNSKLIIMAVVVGLLIVISGVQAIGLMQLKDKLDSEISVLSSSGGTGKVSTGGSGNTLSNNLNNLPSMVGGC